MAIDRIGSKGAPAPTGAAGSPAPAPAAGQPFEARPTTEAQPSTAVGAVTPSLVERVRSGELDLATYIDMKVTEATAHLKSLPATEVESIQNALRDRMATDPTLVGLVRAATGHVPTPPRDDD